MINTKIHHILEWEDDDPIFDFNLYGLKSSSPFDYKLVFLLNKNCKLTFKKSEIELSLSINNNVFEHSVFEGYSEEDKQDILLVSNYSEGIDVEMEKGSLFEYINQSNILLPEMKVYNYLLKCKLPLDNVVYSEIENISVIQKIEQIDINKINNLENLIL